MTWTTHLETTPASGEQLSWPPRTPAAEPSPASSPKRPRRLVAAVLTVALAVGGGAVGGWLTSALGSSSSATAQQPTRPTAAFDGQTFDVATVVSRLQKSVVSISTTVASRRGPFVTQGESAGTGVVINRQGDILTNAHVVAGATTVTVSIPGQSQPREAAVVGADPSADVAVLRVRDPSGLVPAELAKAGTLQVGDQVVAIGNALALEGGMTVTQGIVSALNRSLTTSSGTLSSLIQTDAAISSGNSGGPLVNAAGQVVGINPAVAASSGRVQASNIGFAISIDKALAVADELAST